MRRSILIGTLTVAVLAIGGAGVAVATTQNSAQHGNNFTVVEHAITDTTVDIGPKGDSLGDILAFGNPIYDAGNHTQVGNDQGSCVRTKVGVAWECSWTTILPGGSLTVEGPFYDSADSVLAITGGTGTWARARGQMTLHARDAAGSSYDFRFSVTN
ncbi:MAG TPA: dirigent protein [Pseudonocardiaceae bacterium]